MNEGYTSVTFQAVGRRSVTAGTRDGNRASPSEISCGQMTLEELFLRVLNIYPVRTTQSKLQTHLGLNTNISERNGYLNLFHHQTYRHAAGSMVLQRTHPLYSEQPSDKNTLCLLLNTQFKIQGVSSRSVKAEAGLRSRAIHCKLCGGRSCMVTGLSQSTSGSCCQYHSTKDPYS